MFKFYTKFSCVYTLLGYPLILVMRLIACHWSLKLLLMYQLFLCAFLWPFSARHFLSPVLSKHPCALAESATDLCGSLDYPFIFLCWGAPGYEAEFIPISMSLHTSAILSQHFPICIITAYCTNATRFPYSLNKALVLVF